MFFLRVQGLGNLKPERGLQEINRVYGGLGLEGLEMSFPIHVGGCQY